MDAGSRYRLGVEPRVFRGIGLSRGAARMSALVITYAGGFAVLWGLGLVVRNWQGWALLAGPLAVLAAMQLMAWQRVSAEVGSGLVRYEGSSPQRDFEVAIDRISTTYFDAALPSCPLVLALDDGDERVCDELGPGAARALAAHLSELGVTPVRVR